MRTGREKVLLALTRGEAVAKTTVVTSTAAASHALPRACVRHQAVPLAPQEADQRHEHERAKQERAAIAR